ncbi:MAG: MBL fold metallo-hydrolase [Dehalococcoidia bacterium]|nr:MBL fold metallo-hydrolase [Dehalococcoidia bacterium]
MRKITSGVYQVKVPMPRNPEIPDGGLGYTLVYLIESRDGWTMIDSGWNTREGLDALDKQLHATGAEWTDVRDLIVTHFHSDHLGLAAAVKERSHARLIMHELDAPEALARRWGTGIDARRKEFAVWAVAQGVPHDDARHMGPPNRPEAMKDLQVKVELQVRGNEVLRRDGTELHVLWTPGHTPGHISIYDPRRKLLFSGDHLLPRITPNISYIPTIGGSPLSDYLRSLDELEHLDVKHVLSPHEGTFHGLRKRLGELRRHHGARMRQMLRALRDGPLTAWQIASHVRWRVGTWEHLSLRTRQFALQETVAHLRHMVDEGILRESPRDGVVYYELVKPAKA